MIMKKMILLILIVIACISVSAQTHSDSSSNRGATFNDSTVFILTGKELISMYNAYTKQNEATLSVRDANAILNMLQFIYAVKQREWEQQNYK